MTTLLVAAAILLLLVAQDRAGAARRARVAEAEAWAAARRAHAQRRSNPVNFVWLLAIAGTVIAIMAGAGQ
jgi:hypothetical protein